jgi:hypothetical protein
MQGQWCPKVFEIEQIRNEQNRNDNIDNEQKDHFPFLFKEKGKGDHHQKQANGSGKSSLGYGAVH